MTRITVAEISGEAFDDRKQHRHDARRLFEFFEQHGVWIGMGTEAGGGFKNHDYRDALILEANKHHFFIQASKRGEWVALNRRMLENLEGGFDGPFIPAGGKPAHAPRGIAWASGTAKEADLGRITAGAIHALAPHSLADGKFSNDPLFKGVADWGTTVGEGSGIVILGGDANDNDMKHDVVRGAPFTTLADELGKHPATHGKNKKSGNPIDFIATYNYDKRTKAVEPYRVFDDSDLMLYSDHFLLLGNIEVKPRS